MAIYKAGVKQNKSASEPSTAELIRLAPHGLYFLIDEFWKFINENHAYDQRNPCSLLRSQIDCLNYIYLDLYKFLNPRPLSGKKKNKITKNLRTAVDRLEVALLQYKKVVSVQKLPKDLHRASRRILGVGLRFTESFRFHDGLILKIRNRPTDWALKKRIAIQFLQHQRKKGAQMFPKYPAALKRLNKYKTGSKYQLSARHYWNLKHYWLNNTYWHYFPT